MLNKTKTTITVVAILAVIALVLGVRKSANDTREAEAEAKTAQAKAAAAAKRPRPPRPSPALSSSESSRLELCGRIAGYAAEPGAAAFVTVSVAEPGTAHPIQTKRVNAEGQWKVPLVPNAPLRVGASVPGFVATSMTIEAPEPCERKVYELELAAVPPTQIEGTVVDVFGGAIAGADIDVIPKGYRNGFGFEQPVFRTVSNEEGAFAITVPANEYVVRGTYVGYSSKSEAADTRARERERVELVLSPGASISGRVVSGADGSGVPDAELRLVALRGSGAAFVNYAGRADATSGPDGVFRIDNVAFGSWAIYANTRDAVSSAPTEVSVEIYDDVQDVVVTVEDTVPVYGSVREQGSEEPVAGALVALKGEAGATTCSLSDAEGVFDCGAVPRGRYSAIVSHKQYAGNLVGATIDVSDEELYFELSVQKGYTVEGYVTPPVEGIPVHVRMAAESISMASVGYSMMNAFQTAQTDARGRFSIGPLSLGEVTLIAEHQDHGRGEAVVTQEIGEAGTEVEISLAAAATLTGEVSNILDTDASSLELLLAPIGEAKRVDGIRSAGSTQYTIAVDTNGRFEAQGLEAARYTLSLRHSLGAVSYEGPKELELVEGQRAQVELALEDQQTRFSGVVLDEEGGLVEGAVVSLTEDPNNRTVSDSEGAFSLTAWAHDGALPVRYHRAGYSTAASKTTLRAGEINQLVVPPESSLEISHPGVSVGRAVLTGQTRLERPLSRAGTTSITGLLEGPYTLYLCGESGYGTSKVEVSGRTTAVSVEVEPWLEVKGVALDAEGSPLAGAQVIVAPSRDPCGVFARSAMTAFSGESQYTDDDGNFEVSGLPPGTTVFYFIDLRGDEPQELAVTTRLDGDGPIVDLGELQLQP